MTTPTVRTGAGDERRRLATYIGIDLIAVVGAAVWMAVLRLTAIVPNPWLALLVVLLLSGAAGLYVARVLVRFDRCVSAVTTFAAANWALAVSIAVLSPFAAAVLAQAILLPVILGVRYLSRRQLSALLGGAVLVGATMAVGGSLPDLAGVDADSPRWVDGALAVVFVPAMSGLIALAAWQTHTVLVTRAEALRQSHARLVAAADEVRQRVERDLSRTTQRRVAAATESTRAVRRLVVEHDSRAADALERLTTCLQQASAELRELAHGIYPPELTEHGLAAALRAAKLRSALPTTVAAGGLGRHRPEIENNVYFCCVEAWQNAVTHAGPDAHVRVTVQEHNGLSFEVHDDGVGCAADVIRSGHGFTTMTDRIGAIGGVLTVAASPGRGVHLYGHVPAAVLADAPATRPRPRATAVARFLARVWRLVTAPWGHATESLAGRRATIGIQTLRAVTLVTGALTLGYAVAQPAWLLTDLAATATATILLASALRLARHGNFDQAIVGASVTLWAYAVAITLLAPATLPYSSLMVVIPVVLAASHLRRRPFRLMVGASVAVALLVAAAGRFPPAFDIESPTHPLRHSIAFAALLVVGTAVPSVFAWQNHATLTRRAEALQQAQEAVITASDLERRQIERNLHDCAQQRLVAAALHARTAHRLLSTQYEQVDVILARLVDDLHEVSSELRDLTQGIHSPGLAEHGLEAALRAAAARSPLRTVVTVDGLTRYQQEIETNVYFCCLEGLQNAIKHAGDGATVTIGLSGHNGLSFDIRDDGAGCSPHQIADGHGLRNMRARLASIGGTLTVHAEPGGGVHLHGYLASPALLAEPALKGAF
jgi:signal transduction histidine kinase